MPQRTKDDELNDELNTRRMNKFRQRLSEVRQVVEFIIEHAGHVGCATGDFVRNASRGDNDTAVDFTEQRLDFRSL